MMTSLPFLDGLDEDLRRSVLGQLRDQWTHSSTAIEGNTLSLAETHFVLSEGLTVKGKPLKDHNEVIGHARAIDLLYGMLGREIVEDDLFALHRAVQTEVVVDAMCPNGAWKQEPNGSWGVDADGKRRFVEFAMPVDVPGLMTVWLGDLNQDRRGWDMDQLVDAYARLHIGFTSIHPFWDGNGRMARLISNLVLLNAGQPPLVIRSEQREDYIRALNAYSAESGRPDRLSGPWAGDHLVPFIEFCRSEYAETRKLIDEAWALQKGRATLKGPGMG